MGVLVTWRLFTVQPAHPDPVVADMQGNAAWALQLRLGEQQQGLGCSTDGYGFGQRPSGRNVVGAEISVPRLPVRGQAGNLDPSQPGRWERNLERQVCMRVRRRMHVQLDREMYR